MLFILSALPRELIKDFNLHCKIMKLSSFHASFTVFNLLYMQTYVLQLFH
jgi:hypothetical protein